MGTMFSWSDSRIPALAKRSSNRGVHEPPRKVDFLFEMVAMWCFSVRPARAPRVAIATTPGASATPKPSAVTVTDSTALTSDNRMPPRLAACIDTCAEPGSVPICAAKPLAVCVSSAIATRANACAASRENNWPNFSPASRICSKVVATFTSSINWNHPVIRL
jgi:hypothetical protein